MKNQKRHSFFIGKGKIRNESRNIQNSPLKKFVNLCQKNKRFDSEYD